MLAIKKLKIYFKTQLSHDGKINLFRFSSYLKVVDKKQDM
jgi:hypothetical protein